MKALAEIAAKHTVDTVYLDVVNTSAIDRLERLVSEMTYYVSSGTLNPTHSLTSESLR